MTEPTVDTPAGPGVDLVRHTESLDARIRYARQIAAAGNLLPRGVTDGLRPDDVDKIAARVFLIAETGNMLAIHPVAALQGVNIIEGKPSIAPALMTAVIRRAGHRVRVDLHGSVAAGDVKAVAKITRNDDPEPFVAEWNLDRAVRAGLIDSVTVVDGKHVVRAVGKKGGPSPWQKYTEAMLKWRALGECARDAAEDALMGAHYTPEELGAVVDEDGVYVATEDLARPAAPAEPEQTAQEFADTIASEVMAQPTAAGLEQLVRGAFPGRAAAHSWAPGYPSPWAYAKAHTVTVPTAQGEWSGTLFDLFTATRGVLEAHERAAAVTDAAGDGASPEQVNAAAAPPMYEAQPVTSEPVDAIVVDPEDPWSTPGAMGHDAAVTEALSTLGGTVVEDTTPEATPHNTQQAAQARARDERERREDEGLSNPPAAGTARAAAKAAAHAASARARAAREAEEQAK